MIEVQNSPQDEVTSLSFGTGNQFLTTSWDDEMRLYDCESAKVLASLHAPCTALSTVYKNGTFYSGFVDGKVRIVDLENHSFTSINNNVVGSDDDHSVGISHLALNHKLNAIISATWRGKLMVFDPRLNAAAHSTTLPNKIFAMDSLDDYLVVGMSLRTINIYDHRNYASPVQVRESGLKFQVKDLKCWKDGYALASIDGRVALEYYDPSEVVQAQKFAFKCHRVAGVEEDEVWPVNSLQFGGDGNILYTGGNDTVCLWNIDSRKRVKQYKVHREVSKICVNREYLVISTAKKEGSGTGYDFYNQGTTSVVIKSLV